MAALMAMTALLLIAANLQQPALVPSAQWQVEYAKSSCIVRRAFGEGSNSVILSLEPALSEDRVSLSVSEPASSGIKKSGKASVRLSGGSTFDNVEYYSSSLRGTRETILNVPRTVFDGLVKDESISISAGKSINFTLKSRGFGKVLKILEDCESNLQAGWGFDKAHQAAVAVKAKGTLKGVIQPDDYPVEALEAGISGTVIFRLKVEADGTVSQCAIVESSGSPVLDKQTCAVVRRRARYTPAIGHDGKPIWTYTFGHMAWTVMTM